MSLVLSILKNSKIAFIVFLLVFLFANQGYVFALIPAVATVKPSVTSIKRLQNKQRSGKKVLSVQKQKVKVTPTVVLKVPMKKEYTIAVIGDSMVDTMGERTDYLEHKLAELYPSTIFHLYNYGIGGQNVQQGLDRFGSAFNYSTRHYPSIPDLHPDIIIVGSFAYNPFSPYNRDKHWTTLTQLVLQAKSVTPSVYMLAEIAPMQDKFGVGANGIDWPVEMRRQQALEITEQLENVVSLSTALHVPLINAFYATKVNGEYGNGAYTDTNDGIHPSVAGHMFMADLIARNLQL